VKRHHHHLSNSAHSSLVDSSWLHRQQRLLAEQLLGSKLLLLVCELELLLSKLLLLLALLLPWHQSHEHMLQMQLLALLVFDHHVTELHMLSCLVCEESRSGLWHVCCCSSRTCIVGEAQQLPEVRHGCTCPSLPFCPLYLLRSSSNELKPAPFLTYLSRSSSNELKHSSLPALLQQSFACSKKQAWVHFLLDLPLRPKNWAKNRRQLYQMDHQMSDDTEHSKMRSRGKKQSSPSPTALDDIAKL
jgi:hypothetical protein